MIYLFHSKRPPGLDDKEAKLLVLPHHWHKTHCQSSNETTPVTHEDQHGAHHLFGPKDKRICWSKWKQLVVAWGSVCKATKKDVGHLQSNQEEADTKMILHALDATANGATQLHIHPPNIDVFALALTLLSGIVWEHAVCHAKRATPSYYWAETNC